MTILGVHVAFIVALAIACAVGGLAVRSQTWADMPVGTKYVLAGGVALLSLRTISAAFDDPWDVGVIAINVGFLLLCVVQIAQAVPLLFART